MQNLVLIGGRLCLDFCNTVEFRKSDSPVELLIRGYASLLRWACLAGVLEAKSEERLLQISVEEPERARASYEEAIAIREVVYAIFDAVVERSTPSDDAIEAFNEAVAKRGAGRTLVFAKDGKGMNWEWLDKASSDYLLGSVVFSAVDVLTKDDLTRISRCPGCGWLYYDQSKNRSRTWCDMKYCGNRAKAQRHYLKKKE